MMMMTYEEVWKTW